MSVREAKALSSRLVALEKVADRSLAKAFNPGQERDESGQWTSGGGGQPQPKPAAQPGVPNTAPRPVAGSSLVGVVNSPWWHEGLERYSQYQRDRAAARRREAEEDEDDDKEVDLFKPHGTRGTMVESQYGRPTFKGYPEYNADQDRDESGKWTGGGGGGSKPRGGSVRNLDTAARAVSANKAGSGEGFLDAVHEYLDDLKDDIIEDTDAAWQNALKAAGHALGTVSDSIEGLGVGGGAGVAVGTLAGPIAGTAVGVALGAYLVYHKWMQDRDQARLKREGKRVRQRIAELEYELASIKRRRRK